MRLTDRVEISTLEVFEGPWGPVETETARGTYRANVHYTTVGIATSEAGAKSEAEEIRVILDPMPYDAATMRIVWNGRTYTPNGPAMIRRRDGQIHHVTIPLKLSS